MFERHIRGTILDALADTRVVYVMGPRQAGKSTLAGSIAADEHPASTFSLDDYGTFERVRRDPVGFVHSLEGPVMIDEVQRVPELLLAIKRAVDLNPEPGRFLLTGSTNLLTAPKVFDALTGRVELIRLWPLSQGEIEGVRETLVDTLFANRPKQVTAEAVGATAYAQRVARGGYPAAVERTRLDRREAWFESHLETTLSRDLRDLSDVRHVEEMPALLRLLATRAGNLLQTESISSSLGISASTVKAYISLLETLFLIRRLPAWRPGLSQRVVHARKVHIVDSGLMTYLLGGDGDRVASDERLRGISFESFVVMEILKQLDWAKASVSAFHFRDRDGNEVDLVLEDRRGRVVGIEVKSAATARDSDFKGLRRLRRLAGEDFVCGAVIHTGEGTVGTEGNLWSLPVSVLWK